MVRNGFRKAGATRRIRVAAGLALITSLALMCVSACGRTDPVSSDPPSFTISINMSPSSPALLAVIDQYGVTVIDASSGDTLAQQPLVLIGSFLEGEVTNLPAGVPLIVIVEALEGATGNVIYRGVTTTVLLPNTTADLVVAMIPQPPLVKLTPRHSMIQDLGSHMVSLEVFNMVDLTSLDIRVSWLGTPLNPDSIRIGPQYDPAFVTCSCVLSSTAPEYIIQMNQGDLTKTLVDASGRAILVEIFFSRQSSAPSIDTLRIQTVGLNRSDGSDIPVISVYSDVGIIDFNLGPQ